MTKKIKTNATSVKNINKNISGKNVIKKEKQKKQRKNKITTVKDRNLQFKNKLKKHKHTLAKQFKQIHRNEENRASVNLVNTNTVKLVDIKNKSQIKKTKFQDTNEKKKKNFNNSKHYKQKHQIKVQSSNQFNDNTSNNENLLKKKQFKTIKHKKKQKHMNDNETTEFNSMLNKKLKQKNTHSINFSQEKDNSQAIPNRHKLDIERLKMLLDTKQKQSKKEENIQPQSLRERMMSKLKASRFRYLNETLYNNESSESKTYFRNDPDAFKAYHEGYKQQIKQWPLNPLDIIIASVKKMPKGHIIADFGCGEAWLATSVPHKVHSFDFVSLNQNVIVCDMAHTPLLTNGVHVVVFCLSLMGTNLKDYIIEANRVLKKDGILKIAEVESRFEQVEDFIKILSSYGFKNTWKDLSHNLFYFLDFKKEKDIGNKRKKLPPLTLKPCLYKKR